MGCCRRNLPLGARSAGLCGGSEEDLVQRHPPGAGDGEGDDIGDVFGGDGQLLVELFGTVFGVGMGDVVGVPGLLR